jgi:hypothetical protein
MDETQPDGADREPQNFNWQLSREELLAMSQDERDIYLNEKTSRLYEALTMYSRAEGAIVRREDIEHILNPEEMGDRNQSFEDRGAL